MTTDQIAAEAAAEIGVKAHKNVPALNAYYPEIAESIIKDAIEKATKPLVQVLELCKVASCSCLTKTPEAKYHRENCRYRQICEVLESRSVIDNESTYHLYPT